MARIIPLIIVVIGIYFFWFRSRRRAETVKTPLIPAAAPIKQSARSLELGFLPQQQLDTKRSAPLGPAAQAALTAARAGTWEPAAELLRSTGQDWERRTLLVGFLAEVTESDDGWLAAWEAARPDDPDAAVVRAESTVHLAATLRGRAVAGETTDEQFEGFHLLMQRAEGEATRAAELNPADPTPRIARIWVAVALSYPHDRMRELWSELVGLAPQHYAAHYCALQYWCQKWQGSAILATEFANRAAAGAPSGSLLNAMPLICWYEHEAGKHTKRGFDTPEVWLLVDALLADVAAAPADHPRLREVRLLLVWWLVRLRRYPEAMEQFPLVDGYVGAFPWSYRPDPALSYVRAREEAVLETS